MIEKLQHFIEAEVTRRFIIAVIVINAIILGMETSDDLMASIGGVLVFLDKIAITIFCIAILIKLIV